MEPKKSGRKVQQAPRHKITLPRWAGLGDKTIWDWVNLLVLPIIVTVGGYYFTDQQAAQQQEIETKRFKDAQELENQRAESERELAEQRTQDEALQVYFDQMSELITAHDLLRCDVSEEQCYEVRTLAEARTQTAIQRLDSERNQHLIDFLWSADLLGVYDPIENSETNAEKLPLLQGAMLSGADLAGTNLLEVNLTYSDLSGADLHGASLRNATLDGSDLNNADLSDTYMAEATLGEADLTNADLSGADLKGTPT